MNSKLIKNLSRVMALIALVAVFSSCKKDFTCTCTVAGQTIITEIPNVKKGDAEDTCSAAETTYQIADPTASCSL